MNAHAIEGQPPPSVALDASRITMTEEWAAVRKYLLEKRNDALAEAVSARDFATKEFWRGQLAVLEMMLMLREWEMWKPIREPVPRTEQRIKEIP